MPPDRASMKIFSRPGSALGSVCIQRKKAGMVKTTPAATDSPALPTVCTMLLSSSVLPRRKRKKKTAMTAAGMEADTVMPTLRAR